jgi:hypothetical protein
MIESQMVTTLESQCLFPKYFNAKRAYGNVFISSTKREAERIGSLCFRIIAAVLGHWNLHDSNGRFTFCGWRLDASQ